MKQTLQYIQGSKNHGIKYSGNKFELSAFSDADFEGDLETRRSTSGHESMVCNGPVPWSSRQQKCISRSTTESEYVVASDAAQEIVWLREFIKELTNDVKYPIRLYINN